MGIGNGNGRRLHRGIGRGVECARWKWTLGGVFNDDTMVTISGLFFGSVRKQNISERCELVERSCDE